MHAAQTAFCERMQRQHMSHFGPGVIALDVGSRDINGNNRYLFQRPYIYIGCDVAEGPNVNIVKPAHELPYADGYFDTIVSTECLEHDQHWRETLANCYRMLRPGGLLLITAAGPGRAPHGTASSRPEDCPGLPWPEYYRNISTADLLEVLGPIAGRWSTATFDSNDNPGDTYFCGVKA